MAAIVNLLRHLRSRFTPHLAPRVRRVLTTSGSVFITAILVASFGFVLVHAGGSNTPSPGLRGNEAHPSATSSTVTLAPTPTIGPGPADGGGPVRTPTGAVPFHITAIQTMVLGPYGTTDPDQSYTQYCTAGPPKILVDAVLFYPFDSGGGTVTYRWHVNGTVTDPQSARIGSGTNANPLQYQLAVPAAQTDGSLNTVQVEILSPDSLLGQPGHISLHCLFNVEPVQQTQSYFYMHPGPTDPPTCASANPATTTYSFPASFRTDYGPAGQITYHWVLPDGSQTADSTLTAPPGGVTVSGTGESLTLTTDSPYSEWDYYLMATWTDLYSPNQFVEVEHFQVTKVPACPATPTVAPTATPTP